MLYDGYTMQVTYDNSLKYYLSTAGLARAQATTVNSYDLTDYNQLIGGIWCPGYNGYFRFWIGAQSGTNSWIHTTSAYTDINFSNTNEYKKAYLDISNLNGNYHISSELFTNATAAITCHNDTMVLTGKTYSYENPF